MDFNGKKVAVARFSRPGMNWVSGSIVPLKVGNTAKLADVIAEETGGSVYAIEPAPRRLTPMTIGPAPLRRRRN